MSVVLSNAKFSRLKSAGFARLLIGDDDHEYVINGINPATIANIEQEFTIFLEIYKEACRGVSPRRNFKQAIELFDERVIPALRLTDVKIVEIKDYTEASLAIYSTDAAKVECEDKSLLAADVTMQLPLCKGFRRFLSLEYHAHARFEETAHLLQYANEQPLSKLGLRVEQALKDQDPLLLMRLRKNWQGSERQRRFVRENDIAGIYQELGVCPPGIFYFYHDRRGVLEYMRRCS